MKKFFRRMRNYIAMIGLIAKGFSAKRAKGWVVRVRKDRRHNKNQNFANKRWAYKNGYMPDYVETFGINDSNLDQHISERDYYYLQPINGTYRKWLANKVTSRKIFSPFSEYLNEFYYKLAIKADGEVRINALEDCPNEGQAKEDVIELIKEKKVIAVTEPRRNRSALLKYEDGKFAFRGETIENEEELFERLKSFHKRPLLVDYIEPAKEFSNDYDPFGETIRLVVCHRVGEKPVISEAYVRKGAHYTEELVELKKQVCKAYGLDEELELILESEETEEEATEETEHNENARAVDAFEEEEENKVNKEKYFGGILVPINPETGEYQKGKLLLNGKVFEVDTYFDSDDKIEGAVKGWDELKKKVTKMCDFAPQLEFFGVDVVMTESGFKFCRFINVPKYPTTYTLSKQTVEFLQYKLAEKKKFYVFSERLARGGKKIKLKIRSTFAKAFFPRGLKPYLSVRWIKVVTNDFFTNKDTSLGTKLWAYRHGFLSYRIPQYGITKENHLNFISDFEYMWLRHINGKERVWFEDKITFQYILPQYKQYFPDYYYYIKNENGKTAIVPMMDCKDTDDRSFDAIFELVKDKGVLAMKPDEGSHGDGFYKFSYEDGNYFLNDQPAEAQQVVDILTSPENQYLITEYIKNNEQFKKIYAGAVNTIRMIVFKKDGVTPEIGNVYMRFGSKATGAVDNMGAGGMFVQVDSETGWYGNAKIITQNSIQDCPYHPDTGVLIEGYIPHYEKIKEIILDMAANITELEYFGFDVAVTEDSVKLPEINRFPDFPKIEKYSQETIDYLLLKLQQKKERYGYDVKPCRKLVHLPKR